MASVHGPLMLSMPLVALSASVKLHNGSGPSLALYIALPDPCFPLLKTFIYILRSPLPAILLLDFLITAFNQRESIYDGTMSSEEPRIQGKFKASNYLIAPFSP